MRSIIWDDRNNKTSYSTYTLKVHACQSYRGYKQTGNLAVDREWLFLKKNRQEPRDRTIP